MRAAVFEAIGKPLAVAYLPDPRPGEGEVLVKVDRCGICGSDLHMTEDPVFCLPGGTVLGHEIAATVVETGKSVTALKAGDRVSVVPIRSCGHCASCLSGNFSYCETMQLHGGGFAEALVVHERQCIKLPSTLSVDDGALVEPLAVGLHGVLKAGVKVGEKVLVIGAGPVGLATAYWARKLGAGHVAVTAASRQREDMAMMMGADGFVAPDWHERPEVLREEFGGRSPDIVFECVGKPGLIAASIDAVRRGGKVVVLGLCTSVDQFLPLAAVGKEVCIQTAVFYSLGDFENAARSLDAGNVEPRAMITDYCGLDALPQYFEGLRQRTSQCKVLLNPSLKPVGTDGANPVPSTSEG